MNISDEAVETAAKAIYEGHHSDYKWEDAPGFEGGFKSISLKQARLALEAAAPALMERAWDQGYGEAALRAEYYRVSTNPYSNAGAGE